MSVVRVLHVFGVMERGGAEMRTLEVMRRTPVDRVVQEFCALSGGAGSLDVEIRSLGGEVHHCRLDTRFAPRFLRLLHRRAIDVVHSHVHLASGFILTLARWAGVGVRIAHFRSTADERGHSLPRRAYRAAMRRLIDANATAILGVSAGVLDEAWSRTWRRDPRCRVVYGGVDANAFDQPEARGVVRRELKISYDTPLIVQVGRFDPPKHQRWAANVLSSVATRAAAHLAFVGRGGTPEEVETRRRIARLGLNHRVHFVGQREDVATWICGADVLLLTSTREGLPGVVLEAAAAGTPVVATDLPGVQEIAAVIPSIRAIPRGATADVWADAILECLEVSPTAASREEARRRFAASPFSIEASLAGHLAAWKVV